MSKYYSYDYKDFAGKYQESFLNSGREIVSLVLKFIRPESVIDVGCGNGTLLSVFRDRGIKDILGINGPWVDQHSLVIDRRQFIVHDLREPIQVNRTFDLVVSLEVAEHLPAECTDGFVDSLVKLGPLVLFAAAIPFQGGKSHVNEQWPDYWFERFKKHNYVMVDCLRSRLWEKPKVKWWLAQNSFFYVDKNKLDHYPALKAVYAGERLFPLRCIHPKNYLQKADTSVSKLMRSLFRSLKRKIFH